MFWFLLFIFLCCGLVFGFRASAAVVLTLLAATVALVVVAFSTGALK